MMAIKLCSRTFKNPERARLSQSEFLNPDGNLEPHFGLAKLSPSHLPLQLIKCCHPI